MHAALSARLRLETLALHRVAERSGVMPTLLRGQLPLQAYLQLVHNLHAIYVALETGLQRPGAPPLPAAFARAAALAADLAVLDPDGTAQARALCPATQAYVRRLQHLAATAPALLAAHAYVRYLGDLAGGQMMLRIVARDYPEATIGGRRFYDFGPAAGHGALAAALRASLDALPPALADAIVAEAQSAFERHVALFDELATS